MLPPEWTLGVHTSEMGDSASALAGLVDVVPATLLMEVSHANRTSIALDRMAAFDSSDVRETYDEYCEELMAEHFPVEHLRWQESAKSRRPPERRNGRFNVHVMDPQTGGIVDEGTQVGKPVAGDGCPGAQALARRAQLTQVRHHSLTAVGVGSRLTR